MKKLLLLAAFWASPAFAQNATCPNRPTGDNSAACANTRFVTTAVGAVSGTTPGGSTGQIQYNNAGAFAGTPTGNNVLTALGNNVGAAGAFVVNGGALGTPSSATLTNATGLPVAGISNLGTSVGSALQISLNGTGGLANYVSGSWTPALKFGGGTTGITYSTQTGAYITVGKSIVAQFHIILTSKGSSTGSATITLPTSISGTAPLSVGYVTGMTGLTGSLNGYAQTTVVSFNQWGATGTTAVTDSVFTNTTEMYGTIVGIIP